MGLQNKSFSDIITFTRASGGTSFRPVGYGPELLTDKSNLNGSTTRLVVVAPGALGKAFLITGASGLHWHDGTGITPITSNSVIVWPASGPGGFLNIYNSTAGVLPLSGVSVQQIILDRAGDPIQLFTSPTNVPRIDYDPATGACKGLLIEEQRTNLVTQSNLVGWSGPAVITQNATASPDGQMNGVLVDNLTNGNKVTTVSVVSGSTYTISGYVKRGNSAVVGYDVNGVASASGSFNFDTLATANCTAVSVGGGWYRIAYQVTASSTGALNIYAYGNGGFSAPSGQTYWFGVQCELGAFATSYIPTTGASATRSPDVATINTLSPWYSSAEGTIYCEFNRPTSVAAATYPGVFTLEGGSTLDRLGAILAPDMRVASLRRKSGSADNYATAPTPFVAGTNVKFGACWDVTSQTSTFNGQAPVSGAWDGIPTLSLMRVGTFDVPLNGHIRAIRYTPKRLSDAQLQEMTA